MTEQSRKALVIGANGNIGVAIVQRLHAEGIDVIGADLHPEIASEIKVIPVDITDEGSIIALKEKIVLEFGALDIVVNCSGIMEDPIDSTDVPLSDFTRNVQVNLIGAFLVSKTFIPTLLKSQAGRLIHFSSMLGAEGGSRLSAYSASKAGIIGLVKALGKEYAQTSLTINAVAPAAIDTRMFNTLGEERAKKQLSLIPMGRAGTVQEVAHLVNYIASPHTSFSTGYVFDVSGGRSVY